MKESCEIDWWVSQPPGDPCPSDGIDPDDLRGGGVPLSDHYRIIIRSLSDYPLSTTSTMWALSMDSLNFSDLHWPHSSGQPFWGWLCSGSRATFGIHQVCHCCQPRRFVLEGSRKIYMRFQWGQVGRGFGTKIGQAICAFLKFRIDNQLKIEFQTMVYIRNAISISRRYTIRFIFILALILQGWRYVEPFGLFLPLQCGQSGLYNCNK